MEKIVNITLKQHHALPFKILKRFADALFIILLLTVTFLAVIPTFSHAQGIEEVMLFEENFNDNQAQDWELEPGWAVTEGMLSGIGHKWATYNAGYDWSDYRVNFRLRLLEEGSMIHFNYRLSEKGRYYIPIHREGVLGLSKEDPRGTFHNLAKSSLSKGYNECYNVEIIGNGPRIQVIVNDKVELDYTDQEPLLSGTIAFETLEGAVQVDDIIIFGPSPTQTGPDLAISSTDYWFEDDERVLVLLVEIVNHGFSEATETQIFVVDVEHPDWLNEIRLIPALGPKEIISVEIQRDIPEELRGTMGIFRVVVDPEDAIREIYEENNEMIREIQLSPFQIVIPTETATPTQTVIPTQTETPPAIGPELLQIIGVIIIISGLFFTAFSTLKKDIIIEIGVTERRVKYVGGAGILLVIIGSYILLKCYEYI